MEKFNLENLGIYFPKNIFHILDVTTLVSHSLKNKEGVLSKTNTLTVNTGKYTGRSPNDKFIVDSKNVHNEIAWGEINKPISQENFNKLWKRVIEHLNSLQTLYVFDGFAGADSKYQMSFRVINELASQNLFSHNLLIHPTEAQLESFVPDFTLLVAPNFKCVPERDNVNSEAAIIIDYEQRKILITGTQYSGEIKKSIFSTMNYFMTKKDVLPMHCADNVDENGNTAIFFGLSGTGKTTLSTDSQRQLIGDDEHGWSKEGIFNFEGGCYAKCINLSKEGEPEIYNSIKFGAIVENVVLNKETNEFDFYDDSITENTRVGYPLNFIKNAKIPSIGNHPKTIIFLTADAFGVLPPISKLDINQTIYYFLSGYTSKLAGTERGITTPQATFSTCFGEPFLPLDPSLYAKMLFDKLIETNPNVYLINTGWTGGAYGKGTRMKLKYTRTMVTEALNGTLENVEYIKDDIFGLSIPITCPNIPSDILIPVNSWENKEEYYQTAKSLANRFNENFKKYNHINKEVIASGPKINK